MPCQGLHVVQSPDSWLERGKKRQGPEIEVVSMQIMQMQEIRLLQKNMLSQGMAFLDMIILLSPPAAPGKQSAMRRYFQRTIEGL